MSTNSIRNSQESPQDALQSKEMQDLHQQIDELKKRQAEIQQKIKDNNDNLDRLDDQHAGFEEEIAETKKNIEKHGADSELGKSYAGFLTQLEDLKDKVVKQTEEEKDDLSKNEKENDSIEKQLKETQAKIQKLQQETIKLQAEQAAKEKADKKAKGIQQDDEKSDLGLMFLNAMVYDMKVAYQKTLGQKLGASAESEKLEQLSQKQEEKNLKLKDSAAGGDDGKAYVLMTHEDGKNNVRILSAGQMLDFKKSDEYKNLIENIAREQDVSQKDRKYSVLLSTTDDKQSLLNNLEPLMKRGVNHPEHISDFASSPTKQENLITSILENSKVVKNEEIGGNYFDRFQQVDSKNEQKQSVSEDNIPWHELKKLNLSKEELSPESIDNLKNGRLSNMMTMNDEKQANSFNFKLSLDVDRITNQLHFSMVREVNSPNYEGLSKYSSYRLTPEDKQDLQQFGRMSKTIPFTDPLTGKESQRLLCLDKETNRLMLKDPEKMSFHNAITSGTTVEEIRKFKSGMPIHTSFVDEKGQRFTGWAVLDPSKQGNTRFLKEKPSFHNVDDQYKVQVANNNNGQRAESLRNDKDAVVTSGQTRDNDGSFGEPQTKEQLDEKQGKKSVFLNFSETDSQTIEKITTQGPKL